MGAEKTARILLLASDTELLPKENDKREEGGGRFVAGRVTVWTLVLFASTMSRAERTGYRCH